VTIFPTGSRDPDVVRGRRYYILLRHRRGDTFKAIAADMGLSVGRVNQLHTLAAMQRVREKDSAVPWRYGMAQRRKQRG
jgi:hypothetical protein